MTLIHLQSSILVPQMIARAINDLLVICTFYDDRQRSIVIILISNSKTLGTYNSLPGCCPTVCVRLVLVLAKYKDTLCEWLSYYISGMTLIRM